MKHEDHRFLIIGCGSIGKRHIGNLLSLGVKDLSAFDPAVSRRKEVHECFGIPVLDSLEEAYERSPNVAVVCTPTSLHFPLALEAAKHGCHLFIEKPLSHQLENLEELSRLVDKQSLTTLVGCNMRFHPDILHVKGLIDEGAVGNVLAARVEAGHYLPDWHPWEDYRLTYSAHQELGGGVLLDSIHEIDYICWMLGAVVEVFCFADQMSQLEIDTEDVAAILFRFASGAIGEIHLDYIQRDYSRSCHIIGEEGTIKWDWNEGTVRQYSASKKRWEYYEKPKEWKPNKMYIDEMVHFLRCLHMEERPLLDLEQAKHVLRVALAAKESAINRKHIVLGRC